MKINKFGEYLAQSIPYICLCEDAVSKSAQRKGKLALKIIDIIEHIL